MNKTKPILADLGRGFELRPPLLRRRRQTAARLRQTGVTYATDIKPIFDASCVKCHSGDSAKARLHLDTLEGALKGTKDGKVVKPGDSAKSLIVKAVAHLEQGSR